MVRFLNFPLFILLGTLLAACDSSDNTLRIPPPKIPVPESLIEIYAPENGATLPADEPFVLEYAVVRGDKGRYVELRIDKQKPDYIDDIRGRHFMEGLPAGRHTITLTEFSADDKPTGGIALIHVTME